MAESRDNFLSQIWRSIFRAPVYPGTEKERKWPAFENLILHLHPRTVPGQTLKFTLTWGLGGMSVVLVLLLALHAAGLVRFLQMLCHRFEKRYDQLYHI